MTAVERAGRARTLLAMIAAVAALSYGAAAAAMMLAAARFGILPPDVRIAALVAGVVVAAAVAWRWRWVSSRQRVALWLEERIPELQYALVTAIEPRFAELGPALEAQMHAAPMDVPVWRAARRALLPATLAVALGASAVAASSTPGVVAALRDRGAGPAAAGSGAAPLEGVSVRIVAPSYAGGRSQELRDPETIAAMVGSSVTIKGRVAASGVSARLGERALAVGGSPWQASFAMPAAAAALRLVHASSGAARVIVVEPIIDAPPRAQLSLPARDTLLRAAPASVAVRAELTDDLGLAQAAIEYMISSGQEETYTARTGIAVQRDLGGARTGQLSATLTAATLRLGPGDVLSIRAVARDRNTVSGPGLGTSDTRTIRIARSDEYDSLAVEAIAPVFGDSALLSQRVILQRTEALVRELPSLAREAAVERSATLALDQERLRNRVHSIVFPGHEHADESPLAGEPPDHADPPDPVNADLKVAYEAMWEAGRELRIASPSTAVPPMRVAVEALDRARMADRRYLRGGTARVVVDLERVRLSGTEKGSSAGRAPRAAADTLLRALSSRLESVVSARGMSASARANALSELRVELLAVSPPAAAALGRAASALRSGRNATADLSAARTALAGAPVIRDEALPWSGW
ncbi:MAG TPA: hypothetical protein VFZ56_05610 [Gemmatimonadaceae bacterium]